MATKNKNLSNYNLEDVPSGTGKKVAIVVSEWNEEITFALRDGAIETLLACGVFQRDVIVEYVPGSFELPMGARTIIESKIKVDAVICIGCVIRGETSHFDYVCQGTTYGVQKLNIETGIPTIFCVLTDDNIQQSKARSGGKHGNKGVESAVAALKMIKLNNKYKK